MSEETAFPCKIVSADEVSGLLDKNDLKGFLKSSLDFATKGSEPVEEVNTTSTTTSAKPAPTPAPAPAAFKNPFKKPLSLVATPEPKPTKAVGKRLRRDATAENSGDEDDDDDDEAGSQASDKKPNDSDDEDNEPEEEEEEEEDEATGDDEDDGVDPEPDEDSDTGRANWHPNPYADQKCSDGKLVDLSAVGKKDKKRDKKKKRDMETRKLAMQFIDMEATVSSRKREQEEDEESKPERSSDKKRVSIASYTGDGPSLMLTSGKSSHRLLVVRPGMPLDLKYKKKDDFNAKLMQNIKFTNVYWLVQCYKKNAKENVFVSCAVSSDGVPVKLLSKHWKQIKKHMSPSVVDAIVKAKNVDPRITHAADSAILDPSEKCHPDVRPFYGKVPLVPQPVFDSLNKHGTHTAISKSKPKPAVKKQKKEESSTVGPLEKGQMTLVDCMSPKPLKKPAEPIPIPPAAPRYTPVDEIAKMLDEAKTLIAEKLSMLESASVFTEPRRRDVILVTALKSILAEPDLDKYLKYMWLTSLCCNDERYGNVLEWIGFKPRAPPVVPPSAPKKTSEPVDPWVEALRGE